MRRPTDVLSCYRVRKRLDAWLDGALSASDAAWTGQHVAGCQGCAAEVAALRRVKTLVAEVAAVPEPDWTGFFPGIVRGIREDERPSPAPARHRAWWGVSPRWAMGGAAVAAAMLAVVLWQGGQGPAPAEASVLVNSAESESPGATVMVYTPPTKDLAVVWVFDND